jgi:cytoskeletal protein RodZ
MDDFGGKLRQARERRGISLRQIAASTKISAAALEALERNDISKLPGGIFSRAFVRSYAIEVGLDPDETVREFLDRFHQEPAPAAETAAAVPEEEREFQERQRKAARIAIGSVIALVIVIVALVMAYRGRARAGEQAEPPQVAAASPAPAVPESAAGASEPAPADPAAVSPDAAPAAAASTAPAAAPAGLKVDLHPTGDCWVSVTVDGTKLFARVMAAGERQSLAIQREATVEIGDAGAFAYDVNGKPGKPLGDKGQVRTLTITPATAAQFTR